MTWPLAYTLFVLQNGGVYVERYWLTLPAWIVKVVLVVKDGILFTLSGWIIGRLYRDQLAPMLFAYGASVLLVLLAQWVYLGLLAWDGFRIVFRFHVAIVSLVAIPVSILLGGLWGARPEEPAPGESG